MVAEGVVDDIPGRDQISLGRRGDEYARADDVRKRGAAGMQGDVEGLYAACSLCGIIAGGGRRAVVFEGACTREEDEAGAGWGGRRICIGCCGEVGGTDELDC